MPVQDMKSVLIRLTSAEHARLRTILAEDGLHLQTFFRLAAKQRIQQHAQVVGALEADEREAPEQHSTPLRAELRCTSA